MRRNMTYGLLVLFMLFLITANPQGTGTNGREFITWLSSGWDDTRAFVSSLLGEADTPVTDEFGEVVIPTVPPVGSTTVNPTPTPLPTAIPTAPALAPPADPGAESELGTIE